MNREELIDVLTRLKEAIPMELLNHLHSVDNGSGMILGYLSNHEKATAGELSKALQVSTARITVLIDKLESKGYILKSKDVTDKRITNVMLTDTGKCEAERLYECVLQGTNKMVETIGIDDTNKFIEILEKIRLATKEVNNA